MPGPMPRTSFGSWPRVCSNCGVGWHGGPVCWYCTTPNLRTDEHDLWRRLSWNEKRRLVREAAEREA